MLRPEPDASATQRQQVNHHQFAVVFPPRVEEPRLRMPAHGKRLAPVQHPWPVHALVNLGGADPESPHPQNVAAPSTRRRAKGKCRLMKSRTSTAAPRYSCR